MTEPLDPNLTQPPIDPRPLDGAVPDQAPGIPAEAVLDELDTGVPVAPIARARRQSGVRWAVALLVTVAVVATSAVGVFLVAGQAAPSRIAGYVPADPLMFIEARLDLPGNQRQQLAGFLAHFPGFDDRAIFDQKLDEALDQLVGRSTVDQYDYTTDIKPWFGGEVGLAVGRLPETPDYSKLYDGSGDYDPSVFEDLDPGSYLGLVTVTDGPAAIAWVRATAEKSTTVAATTYKGADLYLVGEGRWKGAFAVHGLVLLAGDEATVKAAIDTGGAGGLAGNDLWKQASSAVPADRLGLIYVSLHKYLDAIESMSRSIGGTDAGLGQVRSMMPAWAVMALRTDGDRLVTDFAAPHLITPLTGRNDRSALLRHLPATTIATLDVRDIGRTSEGLLTFYRDDPLYAEAMKQVDMALGVVGGSKAAFGWAGDLDLVVVRDGTRAGGGIVIESTDADAADSLATKLRNFATLSLGGTGIDIRDETYAGTTITTIDLGPAERVLGYYSAGSGLDPAAHIELAYALTDTLVVVGIGDGFVKSVLDTTDSTSLASSERFRKYTRSVPDSNAGMMYVDIGAIRDLVEAAVPDGEAKAAYVKNIRPYIAPFQAFVFENTYGSDLDRGSFSIYVE